MLLNFLFQLVILFFRFFHWLLRKKRTEAAGTIYESGKYVDCEQESQIHDNLEEKSIFHNHDIPMQSIDWWYALIEYFLAEKFPSGVF